MIHLLPANYNISPLDIVKFSNLKAWAACSTYFKLKRTVREVAETMIVNLT